MAPQVFVYIVHSNATVDDTALELTTAARKIIPDAAATAIVMGAGPDLDAVCKEVSSAYQEVWKIDHPLLSHPIAEVIRNLLVSIIPAGSIVLMAHDHFGMDLAPGLSVKLAAAFLPDAVDFESLTAGQLKAVRQEYSGQVSTHVLCDASGGVVATIRPGAFKADESRTLQGAVIDKSAAAIPGELPGCGRRFLKIVAAQAGDVDITKSDILVSVGRGIEDEENMSMVLDLAKAMGADVACSRPIVDAKWLEKSRQVGTSGLTVKPKVYLALGISGSFQHMGGIKGAPFIVAINKNAKAPIFQLADVGVAADMLELIPELTDKIKGMKG
ncbi:MAG: electron transfer flavoprotein subunit alpha/FixB family protein [Desulfobacterales bacterium]|nr:electron transfer flavoprotein subunit alpha/FixB family protein [Desulfobacterales bacterium]